MAQKFPKLFLYLLGALFFLNFFQSIFTELIYDEAYYWYYAQNLSWGYFDHPPMVAFLIKLSGLVFSGELGVRFVSCILGIGTYVLIWSLVEHKDKNNYIPHFFVLLFSMVLLNAYGFLTLPDTPLLFFTALFLYQYKKFLQNRSLMASIFLGLTMAALMYSKYHAVLVIIFVLLSNLRLITRKYAWLAVITALICYIPHFLWLFENDFVTIKYHLFERPNHAYRFSEFTLGYLLNLIAIFGLLFPWAYWALFTSRIKDAFTRALLFLSYGFMLFFFISSFSRRVQTQWIVIICVPMAILTYQFLLNNPKKFFWFIRVGVFSCLLLLYARLWLIHKPLLPLAYETHGNKIWVNKIITKAGNIPVVFENSYRRAPMYEFYSGNPSFSLNNFYYRRNQYSIDGAEAKMQHQKVLYVSKYAKKGDISYTHPYGSVFYGSYIEDFESFRKLRCYVSEEPLRVSDSRKFVFKVYNPYSQNIPIEKIKIRIGYLNSYKKLKETKPLKFDMLDKNAAHLKTKDTTYLVGLLPRPGLENLAYIRIAISGNGILPGINSNAIKLAK
ncbi:MAG: glycosyltransferase family 39 protein [Bacteroidota bacterium]